MKNIFGLSLRYVKHNIHRSITTAIGIMLSTVIIYLVFSVGYSGYDSVMEQKYVESKGFDAMYICDVKTAEDILTLVPYYNEKPVIEDSAIELSHGFYICVDSVYKMFYINDFNAMPVKLSLKYGEYPDSPEEQILELAYTRELKMSVGDIYDYCYADYSVPGEERVEYHTDVTVSGIYEASYIEYDYSVIPPNYIWENTPYKKVFPEMRDNIEYLQLYITFEDKDNLEEQAAYLANTFDISEYRVNEHAVNAFMTHNDNESIDFLGIEALLLVLATIVAMCAMFIVRNAFNISLHERNKDYGILRCIGMGRKQIIHVIITEAMIISVFGITLGIILGHGLSVVGFSFVRKTLGFAFTFRARFYLKALLLTIVYALVTTCYAMVAPIEKLYKLNPIEALNHKDELKNKKYKKNKGKLLTKIFGFEVGYAYKSIQRRKGRFVITLVTLLISVFLFITLSTAYLSVNKYVDKHVFGKNIYDGYFVVDDYQEASTINSDLADRNLIDRISIYCRNYTSFMDGDGWETNEKTYLGVDKDIFDEIKSIATLTSASKDENIINIIVTEDYSDYKLGETHELHIGFFEYETGGDYTEETYRFYIRGVISKDKFMEIAKKYDIYTEDDEKSTKVPHLIYTLGGKLDGIKGFSEEFNAISSDYDVKIDLKDSENTEEFDKYINDVNYIYYDQHYEPMLIYNTVKSYRIVVSTFIILVLLMYLTNIINVNKADMLIRKKEFKILQHIGLSIKQKRKILLSENMISCVIAIILGSILGTITGNILIYIILLLYNDIKTTFVIDWLSILACGLTLIIFSVLTTQISKERE